MQFVDKFIGDSVIKLLEIQKGNDAQNALNCVRQMQIAMRDWEKVKFLEFSIVKHQLGCTLA